MSIETAVGVVPEQIDDTPVRVKKAGPELPCPQDDCGFQYWSTEDRRTDRTPTLEDEFRARDKPCDHFHTKWSPANGESLTTALTDIAESASEIICVMDEQITLEENAQTVAVYATHQTTLGGF